jgi:hypothetical protein
VRNDRINAMRRFNAICILVLSVVSLPAYAVSLWEGTIGKAAIVVQFDPARPTEGSYFYRRHLLDIALHGETGGDIVEGEAGAHWRMQAPSGGNWSGTWVGADGRELPIDLHVLPTQASGEKEAAAENRAVRALYDTQRLRDLRLEAGARETRGAFQIQWWEEPRSKIRSLQVTAGYSEPVRQKINQRLRERQWDDVNGYFQCLSDPHGDEYSQTVTLHYIDVDAISMSIFTSYDCGGAHPDFGDRPLTIDGRTGEELRLEDVMYVGTGAPPAYQPGGRNDAYFRYRDQVLAPWLAKTMKRLHPKDMPAVADDAGDCDYNQPSIWAFVNWHLRPDGIYVGPSFARAMRACEYPDWSVLPWKLVRTHAGRVRVGPQ